MDTDKPGYAAGRAHLFHRARSGVVFCFILGASVLGISTLRADELDDRITAVMQEHHVAGLSLAVVENGQILKAKGYGFTDKGGQTPVTTGTLFQAGSISKPVAALGALVLVERGRLSLDADVNTELAGWKVPTNEFTQSQSVTLRRILSHTAGLTIHGFPGYATNATRPTLVQVLDGVPPANTHAIRVDAVPGSQWRYSGGGYTIMQQMMMDVSGKPFAELMRETVLLPLAMTNSTYEQPLPAEQAAMTASAYYPEGRPVEGRWHVYPEMAAAGLWTTASDLARFMIAVQRMYQGETNLVLSPASVREMLTVQNPGLSKTDGLGVFVSGSEKTFRFWHDGRNEGFDALFVGLPNQRKGVAVMINANANGATKEAVNEVAKQYVWKTVID